MQPHMFIFVPIRYAATFNFPYFFYLLLTHNFSDLYNTMTTFFDSYLCGDALGRSCSCSPQVNVKLQVNLIEIRIHVYAWVDVNIS